MFGENNCESSCQFTGLSPLTKAFRINSGNTTKRKQEEATFTNFKNKMNPHTLNFKSPSPIAPSNRRVLGEIQNSFPPKQSPVIERLKNSPLERMERKISPLIDRNLSSPVTTRVKSRSSTKISRIFEERTRFKSNKENENSLFISESMHKLDIEEETRDFTFGEGFRTETKITNWSTTKLDFTDALQTKSIETKFETNDIYVPEKDNNMDDIESLQDLEEEFENDNFDQCTKYEIISTDSPNIISRGRPSTSRKVTSRNFIFGSTLSDSEQSISFNRPNATATRTLNFEESFEFTSPTIRKPSTSFSVKKSLKFNETPTKNPLRHERSDSSIGSMLSSPSSSQIRLLTSDSTTSMESGFISELEEPFLEFDASNSPKMAINDLLSGQIKDNIITSKDFLKRPSLQRSLSFNPEKSLLPIEESPDLKKKRENDFEEVCNKRRKGNPEECRRPVLQRAMSENHACIMSALARSASEPDLIGDFSQTYALPLTMGDHSDLKSISCDTLAAVLRGEYDHIISDYQIIDCRYPYEFSGGHLPRALNLHTPALVTSLLARPPAPPAPGKRTILIFHCEFSIQRGPKLYRHLRSADRAKNAEHYPSLQYPEMYLLHTGYSGFYKKHADLCGGYTGMLDTRHAGMLRQHRAEEPRMKQRSAC